MTSCRRANSSLRSVLGGSIILTLAVTAVFGRACLNRFVNLDDEVYVTQNRQVQAGLGWSGLHWAFTSFEASNWHPLTWLSLELDGSLYGAMPFGYHLDNLLWHTANTLLLYLLLWRLTGAIYASAMVAALFGLHPLHVESVAWVAERKDVLSTCCLLLCLHAYTSYARRPSVGRYLLACLWLALGLMAKPMLVSTPLLLLLLDFWPLRRFASLKNEKSGRSPALAKLLLEKLPLFATVAAASFMTMVAQNHGGALLSVEQAPWPLRIENAFISTVSYIGKIFWPFELIPFYPYPHSEALVSLAIIAAVIIPLVTIWSWRQRQERPYVWVGWSWYVISLVPVIGLVQVGSQAMADRYTYVPAIGLFLAAVWLAADLGKRLRIPARQVAGLASLVLVACAALTVRQIGFWHDSQTLWHHALAVSPDNYMAHYCLGLSLRREGRMDAAVEEYRAAIAAEPQFPEAYHNLGVALLFQGRLREAIPCFAKAVRLNPRKANSWDLLGTSYLMDGKVDDALRCYARAVALQPGVVSYVCDLAHAQWKQGSHNLAEATYQQAFTLEPGWADRLNRQTWTLATHPDDRLRNGPLAVQLAEQIAEATRYQRPGFLDTLAAAYADAGQFDQAQTTVQRALQLSEPRGSDAFLQGLRERLRLYELHRPFHQSSGETPHAHGGP